MRTQKWPMHPFPIPRAPMTDFTVAVHPIALLKPAAAAALGMSVDSFERYVQADVCCIRRGRMRLYPVIGLERWAGENAERLLAHAAYSPRRTPRLRRSEGELTSLLSRSTRPDRRSH